MRVSKEGIELPSSDGEGQRKVGKIIQEIQERERRQDLKVSWGKKNQDKKCL